MTLAEIARLKDLAVSPDATVTSLRSAVGALAVELEILMHAYAQQREQLTCARRAIGDLKIVAEDPLLASLYGDIQV